MPVRIYEDFAALSAAAAELFVAVATQCRDAGASFSVALSGGGTPRKTYELLAESPFREQAPWDRTHIFWGDERCVPANDPRSNQRMAREALLDHVPIPASQVHPIDGGAPSDEAAADYERTLRDFFADRQPGFDLVFLGLGENGHTASLFPHTPVLKETRRWVADLYVADLYRAEQDMRRVTLTAAFLNQAATIAFVVSGANKAPVVREILAGPHDPERLPAQLIKPASGEVLWLLDRDAAGEIEGEKSLVS